MNDCEMVGKTTKRDVVIRKIKEFKNSIKMFCHSLLWGFLHFIGLGIWYSKFTCKIGFYRKFVDGRCMWCGEKH